MRLVSVVIAVVALLVICIGSASAEQFDDTPPPAPTEVVDPYGDGEDENGLIPDDNGEDIDEELNDQPFADQDADPVVSSDPIDYADQTQDSEGIDENGATVTQLPDTGSGFWNPNDDPDDGRPWGFWLLCALFGLFMGEVIFRIRH